ncbi:putative quinol monooxygenase [Solimonas marina]|uniref:Antibiotic biosynthesis monooxygenase n=1 Tax=Solimonas marina TaxID=2714601 RepID=A0A969WCI6_9GAMM|nr:putative quinol monooxygenase [Solimonas marina]NKF23508.1 antibiotic biosynthesis monooxygenase [Solimonas marina]
MLKVLSHVRAKPESAATLRELFRASLPATRAEPGCIRYVMLEHRRDPALLAFVEEWADDAAFKQHFTTPHMIALAAQLDTLVAEPPQMHKYEEIDPV